MLLSATKAPTVSERALRMLELIAKADEPPTLNELMAQLDLAKATTHGSISSALRRRKSEDASYEMSLPVQMRKPGEGASLPGNDCQRSAGLSVTHQN
jgi:hypothetical protein